jgi:integrase
LTLQSGEQASSYTKETVAATVKTMFRDAVRMGLLTANCAENVPSSWGGDSARRRAIIPSMRDLDRLAQALDEVWPLPRWGADLKGPNGEGRGDVIRLAAYTGMRWEELAALKSEAVDLRYRTIEVQDTATESGGRREVLRGSEGEKAGKTAAATRILAVVDQAEDVIKRLEAIRRRGLVLEPERERRRQARGVKRPPNLPLEERWTLLSPGETGGYMSYGHFRKHLEKAQTVSGVDLTIHELRHIAASILIASGARDTEIQEQMGHTSVNLTRRKYGHVFKADRRELARRISAKIDVLTIAEVAEDRDEHPDAW